MQAVSWEIMFVAAEEELLSSSVVSDWSVLRRVGEATISILESDWFIP